MKRVRQDNWSEDEKRTLSELMKQYISVVESKRNNIQAITKKRQAWDNIYKSFVAEHGSKRDMLKIKEQWKRIKLEAKKDISQFKKYEQGTGGGPPAKNIPSELSWLVKDMLPHEFEKDNNLYDDDADTENRNNNNTRDDSTNNNVVEDTITVINTEVLTLGIEEREEVESCAMTVQQPHASNILDVLTEVIEKNPTADMGNIETVISAREGSEEVHLHSMAVEQPKIIMKPRSKQLRKAAIRQQVEDGVSRYTKDFLELQKERIIKQMKYDKEKHEEEMKVLKLQQKYWQQKQENHSN